MPNPQVPNQTVVVTLQGPERVVQYSSAPQGPVGPAGPTGATGPQGPTSAPQSFTLVAVSTWTQAHGFAYKPDVRVIDATNAEVFITATYPDATHVSIVFPTPFTGTVLLS